MIQTDPLRMNDICFKQFSALIHQMMGITIGADRKEMLSGRLRSRMRELDLDTYESYFEYLTTNKSEHGSFVNAITTNETYFYRTPRIWNYVSGTFIPDWYQANRGKTLKVWSAASSTGEEAHTLGVVMQQFKDKHPGFDFQILGTDIAPAVVEHARRGLYKGRAIERFRNTQADLFSRYLIGDDENGFRVLPDIKSRLQFNEFNLFDCVSQSSSFDLVLLRNVLIYFTKDDQKKVMANLHHALVPQGVAIIGESETLNNLDTEFEPVIPTIYRVKDASLKQQIA